MYNIKMFFFFFFAAITLGLQLMCLEIMAILPIIMKCEKPSYIYCSMIFSVYFQITLCLDWGAFMYVCALFLPPIFEER